MPLDAGQVFATLGGNFNPAGFAQFGAAMNKAKTQMTGAEQAITQSSRRSQSAVTALGAAGSKVAKGGVFALGAALVGSVKKAADFEQTLNVFKATADATDGQMKKVAATAKKLGNDMTLPGTSAADAATAMTELAKGGLDVEDSMAAATGALRLSAAAQISNADAATIVADNLNAFGLKGREAAKVADLLAAAANATTASIPEMGDALKQTAASAHNLGIPLKDTVALIGELANKGIKGQDAGTSIKTFLSSLTPSSDKAAKAMKSLNVEAFDSQGKFRGIGPIIKDFQSGLKGLSDEARTSKIKTIFGSDASRAASMIFSDGIQGLAKMRTKVGEVGAAQKLAEAQTRGFKGSLEGLKSTAEGVAINVGEKLLPKLTQLAKDGSNALGGIDSAALGSSIAGGLDTAVDVLGNLAHAGGEVVHVLGAIGGALNLGDAGNLTALAAGLAGFKIAKFLAPDLIALAGGISRVTAAAKGGTLLSSMFAGLKANPVTAIATAAGIAAVALVKLGQEESRETEIANRSAEAHKKTAEGIKSVQQAELAAADKGLAAKGANLDRKRAIQDTAEALKKYGKNSPEYQRALVDEGQATIRATATQREYTKSVREQTHAAKTQLDSARGRFDRATEEAAKLANPKGVSSGSATKGSVGVTPAQIKQRAVAEVAANKAMEAASRDYVQALARQQVSETSKQRLMQSSTQITQKNAQGIASLIRALDGVPKSKQTKILMSGDQAALSRVGNLIDLVGSVPTKKMIKTILSNDEPVKVKLRAVTALVQGVPRQTVANILARTDGEESVHSLQAAINQIQSKSVTITTRLNTIGAAAPAGGAGGNKGGGPARPKRAAGRGPIGPETALVAEGRGPEWRVNVDTGEFEKIMGPQFRDLAAGDYIVPTESRYRGRALGLLADIAKDLGVPAFAKGKAAKPKSGSKAAPAKGKAAVKGPNLPVPDPYSAGAVDEGELQNKVQAEREAYQKRQRSITDDRNKLKDLKNKLGDARSEETKVKGRKKSTRGQKDAAHKKVTKLEGQQQKLEAELARLKNGGNGLQPVAAMKKAWEEDQKNLRKLQATNREIARLNTVQQTERQKMENASKASNVGAYDAAKRTRNSTLADLKSKLELALKLSKSGSPLQAEIDSQLQGVVAAQQEDSDFATDGNGGSAAETEADRIQSTGYTDAERAAIANSDRDIALAALTETLEDDKTTAGARVSLFDQILASAQADPTARGGASAIADIAGALKSAKDNVVSLTSGSSTTSNENADLQAQLDQSRAREQAAQAKSRALGAAVTAFAGPGDIGTGRFGNAFGAAQPGITINTLHPGDPRILQEIAGAAIQGMGLQNGIISPSQKVGL